MKTEHITFAWEDRRIIKKSPDYWPDRVAITPTLLRSEKDIFRWDGTDITIKVLNGEARYKIEEQDGPIWYARLLWGTQRLVKDIEGGFSSPLM